ncbi:MAG: protein meaA [Myxococcota bacterium]|nr:protein meaA [Myxococcota bacterium]
MKDRPWIMRTYAGHSSARASNALFQKNLAKGQSGLSVAFDLPTQTGLDADHPLALGEVGRVGVPISTLQDMDTLFEDIPLGETNTSLTINATAPWLLALYIALAEQRGVARQSLRGTVQNDLFKEYLSRGTHIFPPIPSRAMTADLVAFTVSEVPKWNPINVCSYHLQEAGASPVQEVAWTLANAIDILDAVDVPPTAMPQVVGRMAFFCNAGIRFIEEMCKMRAFTQLWDRITRERYGITDPKLRRFRCGVQVNSLGLTESQPENNVPRIVLESLGVLLSRDARARALQLPAWNEALGLPRPWDQQWSLRIQQILAYETDLLEYPDLFEGSVVVEAKTQEIAEAAWAEIERIIELGGAFAALESGELKQELVQSLATKHAAVQSNEQIVVGRNQYTETEPSPLLQAGSESVVNANQEEVRDHLERLNAHRAQRNTGRVQESLSRLAQAAQSGKGFMDASIACAHAGVTTGEWAQTLRTIHGEYRAPTGVGRAGGNLASGEATAALQQQVEKLSKSMGRRLRILVGKPGLDGHSNGAEQIAIAARDAGMEVVYQGIRLTPEEIVSAAIQEDVHVVGLSLLSGSHLALVPRVVSQLDVPVVVGGIISKEDTETLLGQGVSAVFTPKDYRFEAVLGQVVEIVARAHALKNENSDGASG